MNNTRYGTQHQKLRAEWKHRLDTDGIIPCYRCGRPIYAHAVANTPQKHVPNCHKRTCEGTCWWTWDLGHTDDGSTWHGPEHSCCNRQAGGRNAAQHTNTLQAQRRQMRYREW